MKETAILVELIKPFPMENVFAKQDTPSINVEFAHSHAETVSLYSKAHVLFAP